MDNTVKTKFDTPQQEIDALNHVLKGEHETLIFAMKKIYSQSSQLSTARSRVEELEGALRKIQDLPYRLSRYTGDYSDIARQALSGKAEPVEKKEEADA